MNLYEIIKNELDEKDDLQLLDKLNYIYIRTLQLLSYDSRWDYFSNSKLKDELFEKEVNIFDLDDKRVICSNWSRVFTDLVNCLLSGEDNFDMAFTEGNTEPHMFSRVFLFNGTIIDYDSLKKTNDFVRAKKHLPIKGINIHNNKEWIDNQIDIEFSLNRIGYEINQINYLKGLKDLLKKENVTGKEILDELLKSIDYNDLDLIELNTFLNMQYKKHTGKDLIYLGIDFDKNDYNSLIIKDRDKVLYKEEENYTKVNIIKL